MQPQPRSPYYQQQQPPPQYPYGYQQPYGQQPNYRQPQPPQPEVSKKGFDKVVTITIGTKAALFVFGAFVGSIVTFLFMTYVFVR